MLLLEKTGDISWYFKTYKGVSINPKEISICNYKEMLIAILNDALQILGYTSAEKVSKF